ncbi:nuclear transport factor 2 family protein [Haliea sp. E1-2-M8]|uniref:nuclear transport factor 2 family protein n=1 Tax=Haliea sp. E1-2-M8 TaxID=3064706 RepID=UPI002725C877|nr:nuclear transport factor 2 family protein [Haliea sp. E1-2-M8]MDO8863540.1 nuclear transport factor 2 family protein [Haliea sp. E1-2-M8]
MNLQALPADLAARYARAVDDRDFVAMESIMWQEFTQQGPGFRAESRAVFVANLEFLRQFDSTFHLLGQVTGEWQGNSYRGETWCVASHFYQREGRPLCFEMYIRYQDVIEVRDGEGRYLQRDLTVVAQDERELRAPSFGG